MGRAPITHIPTYSLCTGVKSERTHGQIDFIRRRKEFVGFLEMSLEGIHLSLGNGSLTWLKEEAEAFTLFIALFITLYSAVSGDIFPV